VLAAALIFGAPALAQSWTEQPYDPPVGGRWQILSQTDSEENRAAGEKRDQHLTVRSELTIEEKLADGLRISFVTREITARGNAPGTELAATAFGAMKDIVIRARTDRSGKPVEVENLEELRTTMRSVIDRMVTGLKNPQVAAVIKDMLEKTILVEGREAARTYIEDVPLLAVAQNTGLAAGAGRRETEEVPNPLGGTIKSTVTTRLESWDAAAGTARYVRTRDTDPEAVRAFALALVRKIMPAAGNDITPKMIEVMEQIKFDMSSRASFDVEAGMTRRVEEVSTITVNLMGRSMTKTDKKVIQVTPLPKS
jgi:hypothetical protein